MRINVHQATELPLIKPLIHLAQVSVWGAAPQYLQAAAPELPSQDSDEVQIQVRGSAAHMLVRLRASGKHYSAKSLPHTPGVDGVGITSEGQRVYFMKFGEDLGSFAEIVNIPRKNVFPLPFDTDELQVAALVNPAMSSWMALRRRTIRLPQNFSVLIMGATSLSGTVAIQISRALGAGRVIGCARDRKKLAERDFDEVIPLQDCVKETDFSSLPHVDIILDYLYGQPAAQVLVGLKSSKLVQYLQIGDLASPEIVLPSKAIRSKNVMMIGSGIGSFTMDELRQELPDLLKAIRTLPQFKSNVAPLSSIENLWNKGNGDRLVFVP